MEIVMTDNEVVYPIFKVNDLIIGEYNYYMIIMNNSNNKYQWLSVDTGYSSMNTYDTIDSLVTNEFSHKLLKYGKCDTYELVKSDKLKLIINK